MGEDSSLLDLGAAGRALRRRWWLLLVSLVVAAVIGVLLVRSQPKVYESTAALLFSGVPDAGAGAAELAPEPDRFLQTQAELLLGPPVRLAVEAATGGAADYVAQPVFATDVIEVTARAEDPELAAATANAAATSYLSQRATQAEADTAAATEQLRGRIAALDAEIAAVDAEVAANAPAAATIAGLEEQRAALINERVQLRVALARGDLPAAASQITAQIAALDAQIAALDGQIVAGAAAGAAADGLAQRRTALIEERAGLRSQLDEWTIGATLAAGTARVVAPAEVNEDPVAPQPVRTLGFALAVGLLVGLALVFLTTRPSAGTGRVRTVADLQRGLPGVPVLGELGGARRSRRGEPQAEELEALRRQLGPEAPSRPAHRIQLTSSHAGTTTAGIAANLAASYADAGLRTLVVDANLAHPQVAQALGLDDVAGLADVLRGETTLARAVLGARDRPLGALPAGRASAADSRLLGGRELALLLSDLADSCDVLVIDTPPVLDAGDAAVISLFVDSTVVVAEPGPSTLHEVRAALDALGRVNARVGGVVLATGPTGAVPAPGRAPAPSPAAPADGPRASITDVDRGAAPAV